ncbi:MAG: SDR family oxidoreductase [Bacteroidota bacterium]
MNIVLTGATGTLGSKILFELLNLKFHRVETIYLIVRKKGLTTPQDRIMNMLTSGIESGALLRNLEETLQKIKVVDADIVLRPNEFLNVNKKYHLIHSAGYVNLSVHPSTKAEIFTENYEFTKQIFEAFKKYTHKFTYISTAFSIGDLGGLLENDYLKITKGLHFRNPYEASKNATEKYLVKAGTSKNIPIQILRPSVLGGNIIDHPNFFISKYMVFYLFAKFFYKSTSEDTIRIMANLDSGLNIIPTDYAAKVIVKVLDTGITQLNIVHSKATNIIRGISKILDTVEFKKFNITQDVVSGVIGFESTLEKLYYETIGVHLTPYLTSKPSEWDTTLLESILPIPKYDLEEYLVQTVEFAKNKNFRNQNW